jgi:hypothetical protein
MNPAYYLKTLIDDEDLHWNGLRSDIATTCHSSSVTRYAVCIMSSWLLALEVLVAMYPFRYLTCRCHSCSLPYLPIDWL